MNQMTQEIENTIIEKTIVNKLKEAPYIMVFARYHKGELLKLYCLVCDEYHDYTTEIRRMNDVYIGIGYNSVTNVYGMLANNHYMVELSYMSSHEYNLPNILHSVMGAPEVYQKKISTHYDVVIGAFDRVTNKFIPLRKYYGEKMTAFLEQYKIVKEVPGGLSLKDHPELYTDYNY